ncbi:asparaginase [Couchioplanes caeruleus]|uniref:L-asparaginase n=2 Tax=Couchioplanes caeruleus TaxID=56438 RepID=A0A1K0H114_9ACTN|nr:asparaginase [Couchioplanes caeruleus]OJF15395.1 L-asparaginase [Couchioplanes caeruleus subsp. caeruleus]ROP33435.1 L-asparaginase [Couchioplanes caeruleus]
MAEKPASVLMLSLGGTIAMTSSNGPGGVVPTLTAEDLIAAVPGLAETGIEVQVQTFRQLPGASLDFDDLTALATLIAERTATGGVDGVVVTQGTDTIEETAYLLDLLHAGDAPVVITGAMRNPTMAGADGPANVLAAIRTAASPITRTLGAVVVFADEIHAARHVRKTHSTSVATFRSPNTGLLGHVIEGTVRLFSRPPSRLVVPLEQVARVPRIGLYTVTLGDDGALLASADDIDGLVVAGFGVGHVPQRLIDRLTTLAARIPLVLTSRTGAGPALQSTYAFPGSETDLQRRGLTNAGFLDPYKARILLHALLATSADHDTIAAAFSAAGGTGDAACWPWPAHDSKQEKQHA